MQIEITHEMIDAACSKAKGWTRAQLEALGVPWPPVKGWKSRIAGTMVEAEKYERFRMLGGKGQPTLFGDSESSA